MATYDSEQLDLYFRRIKFQGDRQAGDPLRFLTDLQQHQLVSVPFESLSLHYSATKTISLEPQDLFQKIVVRGRGGYCLETNKFFSEILRSIGFSVMNIVCRIGNASRGILDGGWRAMSHMANIVTIDNMKYLVDVGYGVDGPCRPIPLVSGQPVVGTPGQELVLVHRKLPQHTRSDQRVWVYSQRRNNSTWAEIYHFMDVEFFPNDFEILNHYNSTCSLFARTVVVQRFTFNSDSINTKYLAGTLLLLRNQVTLRTADVAQVVEILSNEEERLNALENYSTSS